MADNVTLNSGSGGDTIAADEVGGVKIPRSKIVIGADGSNDGDVSSANPLPVSVASIPSHAVTNAGTFATQAAQSGAWNITNVTGTVSLPTGAATAAKQPALGTAGTASADVLTVQGIASMTALKVDGSGVTQPVSGTFWQATQPVSGTFWQATQPVSLASAVAVTDNGGSLTVDGTVAATQSGTWTEANSAASLTALQLIDNIVLAEDAAHASADPGVQMLAVRKATPANVSGTDGDYEPLQVSAGRLWASATIDAALPAGANVIGAVTQSGTWNIGSITTLPALPAGTNNIGDVDVLTLPALPAGTNNIGDVDVLTVPADPFGANADAASATGSISAKLRFIASTGIPVTGTVTVGSHAVTNAGTFAVQAGTAAHDAAVSGNPVRTAARARTSDYTAVASDDTADVLCDVIGKQVVLPYSLNENLVSGVTAAITNTTDTSVIAAAGAGIRNYVTALTVTNSHATVSTVVELKDGTTVIWRGYALAAGGGFTINFPSPLRGTANTAINAAAVTTGSNVYVSAAGFKAP